MAEYIEREAALTALSMAFANEAFDECEEETVKKCMRVLHRVPTADVAPARHGRWNRPYIRWFFPLKIKNPYCFCTNCLHPVKPKRKTRYCPECGAKMKRG